jgi:hypothetical protein
MLLVLLCLGSWPATDASAQPKARSAALLTPTQGDPQAAQQYGARIGAAVRSALESQAVRVVSEAPVGPSLVRCETPECMESLLVQAGAELGIVPALWHQPQTGGYELTLTFIERSGRTANVEAMASPSAPEATVHKLVEDGLERRTAPTSVVDPVARAAGLADEPNPVDYWKAGPALLIAGGVATLVAIGVKAAQRGCSSSVDEVCIERTEFNKAALATASVLAAGALIGGTSWWVLGRKRRRETHGKHASLQLGDSQIHFRLDY